MRTFLLATVLAVSLGTKCVAATYGFTPTQMNGPLAGSAVTQFFLGQLTLVIPNSVVATGYAHQEAYPLPQLVTGANGFDGGFFDSSIVADLVFGAGGNIVGGFLDMAGLTTSVLFRNGPVFEFDVEFDAPGDCSSGKFDNGCTGLGSFNLVPGTYFAASEAARVYSTPEPGTFGLVAGLIAILAAATYKQP